MVDSAFGTGCDLVSIYVFMYVSKTVVLHNVSHSQYRRHMSVGTKLYSSGSKQARQFSI